MSLTDELLRPLLASPAKPLITHYDDQLGSRVELSVATTANWAAKTANWLTEEFDIEPGDAGAGQLPAHWQTVGVLLGAWWCGARVVTEGAGARVAFVGPDAPEPTGATATAVVTLDPMGRGLSAPPGGRPAQPALPDPRPHGRPVRVHCGRGTGGSPRPRGETRPRRGRPGAVHPGLERPGGHPRRPARPPRGRRAPRPREQRGRGEAFRPPRRRAHHGGPPRLKAVNVTSRDFKSLDATFTDLGSGVQELTDVGVAAGPLADPQQVVQREPAAVEAEGEPNKHKHENQHKTTQTNQSVVDVHREQRAHGDHDV